MRVVIVSAYETAGGASRAARRLHDGLKSYGVDSLMVVRDKESKDSSVIGQSDGRKKISRLLSHLDRLSIRFYRNKSKTLFSNSRISSGTIDVINNLKPDVVNIHWIDSGFLSIKDLEQIKAPIVWSLHDMWAFTGGCHYNEGCRRYLSICGKCPVLQSSQAKDLSTKNQELKLTSYRRLPSAHAIGLSEWISKCARESKLFSTFGVTTIPNPINANTFHPIPQIQARTELCLPLDKKIILFGANGADKDLRKGFAYLKEALKLSPVPNGLVVIFGGEETDQIDLSPYPVVNLGKIYDDARLNLLYNCADVMVVPSLQENLSNAIMESLSASVPVVAFDVGGNRDMIDHQKNGYLAEYLNSRDLLKGIDWVISHPDSESIKSNARSKVESKFKQEVVIPRYIQFFSEIVQKP